MVCHYMGLISPPALQYPPVSLQYRTVRQVQSPEIWLTNLHVAHKAVYTNAAVAQSVHKHLAGLMVVWRRIDEHLHHVIAAALTNTMGSDQQMCLLFRYLLLSHFLWLSLFRFSFQLQWITAPSGSTEKTTGEKYSSYRSLTAQQLSYLQAWVLKVLEAEGFDWRAEAQTAGWHNS